MFLFPKKSRQQFSLRIRKNVIKVISILQLVKQWSHSQTFFANLNFWQTAHISNEAFCLNPFSYTRVGKKLASTSILWWNKELYFITLSSFTPDIQLIPVICTAVVRTINGLQFSPRKRGLLQAFDAIIEDSRINEVLPNKTTTTLTPF